jgi:hypothetical protein
LWGWGGGGGGKTPQLGDESPPVRNNFRKKKVFRKIVIQTKIFVHLYGLFFVRISFKIRFFLKERLFERTV